MEYSMPLPFFPVVIAWHPSRGIMLPQATLAVILKKLKRELELKEVPSGANLQIIIPYDEGVYYKAQEVNSTIVANPIQIYLDLYNVQGPRKGAGRIFKRTDNKNLR